MIRITLMVLAIICAVASTACSPAAPHVVARALAPEPVVRISQGFFPPALLPEVRARLEAALQMNTLQAMLAQRDLFVAAGVEFQPVRTYTGLWSIAP